MYIFEGPRGVNFMRPSFIHPPPLEGCFQGWGGGGVQNLVPYLSKPKIGAIYFVDITKESLYKANSLACFLAKRDTPAAATLQRTFSGGSFSESYKHYYKNVPGKYFVIIWPGWYRVCLKKGNGRRGIPHPSETYNVYSTIAVTPGA